MAGVEATEGDPLPTKGLTSLEFWGGISDDELGGRTTAKHGAFRADEGSAPLVLPGPPQFTDVNAIGDCEEYQKCARIQPSHS